MIQFLYSKKNKLTALFAEITFGAASVASYKGDDLTLSRTGVGEYTIVLKKKLHELLGVQGVFSGATVEGLNVHVLSADMSIGEIVINTEIAGTETDPASGNKLLLELKFNNSSVK